MLMPRLIQGLFCDSLTEFTPGSGLYLVTQVLATVKVVLADSSVRSFFGAARFTDLQIGFTGAVPGLVVFSFDFDLKPVKVSSEFSFVELNKSFHDLHIKWLHFNIPSAA